MNGVAASGLAFPLNGLASEDPLDHDLSGDRLIAVTRRSLLRVALVAAEVAARFTREACQVDAMSWMLAPRQLFGGAPAIEACLDRDACERALLLHGLSLGLDADPRAIDELRPAGWPKGRGRRRAEGDAAAFPNTGDVTSKEMAIKAEILEFGSGCRRLYSATVIVGEGPLRILAFHASFAMDEGEVRAKLVDHFGFDLALCAEVRKGFDAAHPLVPPEVAKLLLRAVADGSDAAHRLDVTFKSRVLVG